MSDPWRYHRILKRIGVTSTLFIFLTVLSVALGLIDERSRALHMVMICWSLLVLVMLTVNHEARCPRCGQRFYVNGLRFWQMTRKCLHCGQKKYTELGETVEPEAL